MKINFSVCTAIFSKIFDRRNLRVIILFSKLVARNVPVLLLRLVERWFSLASTCVKWGGHVTHFFKVFAGVRQGGVLSSCLFAIYVDDAVKNLYSSGLGCNLSFICTSVFLYDDDVLLLLPSVHALQAMLLICELELLSLDLCLNHNKSVCKRVGSRFNADCAKLTTRNGHELEWVNTCLCLVVFFYRPIIQM